MGRYLFSLALGIARNAQTGWLRWLLTGQVPMFVFHPSLEDSVKGESSWFVKFKLWKRNSDMNGQDCTYAINLTCQLGSMKTDL